MTKKIIWIGVLSILFISANVLGQLSYGGAPISRGNLKSNSFHLPFINMPQLSSSDKLSYSKSVSLRFAHPFFVNYTLENSGKWDYLPDGTRFWRLAIRSAGAYSLNIIFDKFILPEGSELYIYNPDRSMILGKYTSLNNVPEGCFATTPVVGDEIIVEYIEFPEVTKKAQIKIGAINHDFLGVYGLMSLKSTGFGGSDVCNVNVTCENPVPEVSKSVCKIIVDGTELCSGTLLNNTSNDGKPYFLTAAHCLKYANLNQTMVFFFNYQAPGCNGFIEGTNLQSLSGAYLRMKVNNLDVALVEIKQKPPAVFRPYWAGWTLASSISDPVYAIHHPWGDVKKIAKSTTAPISTTFSFGSFYTDAHWRINRYASGVTEPGSSGCGLFNKSGLLIGSLSGGGATCSSPTNEYYARLNKSWDFLTANDSQLKHWLDPLSTGKTSLVGSAYYGADTIIRISNKQLGDSAIYREKSNASFGFWMGQNTQKTDAFAETFPYIKSAKIYGVYLMVGKSSKTPNRYCHLKIYDNLGVPSSVVASKNNIPLSSLKEQSENLFLFDTPINVIQPVIVGVEYDYDSPDDSLGVYWQSSKLIRSQNSAYIRKNGEWFAFPQINPSGLKTSVYLDLLASDVVYQDTSGFWSPLVNLDFQSVSDNNQFSFSWEMMTLNKVEVYNLTGKLVSIKSLGSSFQGSDDINAYGWASGVYVARFYFSNRVQIRKFLVR